MKRYDFDNAKLFTDSYLDSTVKKNGGGEDVTVKEVLLQYYCRVIKKSFKKTHVME